MEYKQETLTAFYQNLGKLFFAISAVDNNVREEEFKRLQELVKNEWFTTDIINPNDKVTAQNTIINTFKSLNDDNEYDAETCYNGFINYKKKHEELFSISTKRLIMKTAAKIAASFSGQNKSELIMLAKLNIELKKNEE